MAKWCTIASIDFFDPTVPPVDYWDNHENLNKPIGLGHNVIFRLVPDWLKEEQILKALTEEERNNLIGGKRFVLMLEYTADSLGDPDPELRGKKPRSKQVRALELIQLANIALWLAKPSSISFNLVIHADCPTTNWSWRQIQKCPPLLPHHNDSGNRLTRSDVESAQNLHLALYDLPRDGAIWVAVGTLWKSLLESQWEIRYVLLWIAMEALFGPDDARETTYRLSQRVAFFLATDKEEAQKFFEDARTNYGWRSKVVHGMRLSKLSDNESRQILHRTEEFVRKTLNRLLNDPKLIQIFSGKNRESYLDNLPFSV